MNNKTKIVIGAGVGIILVAAIAIFFVTRNKTFNVSFESDGGSFVPMQEVKKGERVTKPTDPTKNGYNYD